MHLDQCLAPKTLPGLKAVPKSLATAVFGSAAVSAGETQFPLTDTGWELPLPHTQTHLSTGILLIQKNGLYTFTWGSSWNTRGYKATLYPGTSH